MAGKCTDYTNTAVIDETDQSDTQTVTVCVGKDLTVTKTAAGTFDRTYKWLIDKSVDKTRDRDRRGRHGHLQLHVKVTPNGYTDSGWTLGGTITVDQPERLGGHHRRRHRHARPGRRLHGHRGGAVRGTQERQSVTLHYTARSPTARLQRQEHRHGDLGQGDLLHAQRLGLR